MTQELKIQKIASFVFALLLATILEPLALLNAFIVLGQGHFFVCYYYQYKAGKINRKFLLMYIPMLIGLFFIAPYFSTGVELQYLDLAVGAYFIIHFLFDEISLFDKKPSIFTTLAALPILILFIGYNVSAILGIDHNYFLSVSGFMIAILMTLGLKKKYELTIVIQYFLVSALALFFFLYSSYSRQGHIVTLAAFIVLIHYVNFYIHYFFKVRSNAAKKKEYLSIVFLVNFAIISGFVVYKNWGIAEDFFDIWFLRHNFWIWTILHIFFTTRISDFKDAVRIPVMLQQKQ